MKRQQLLFGTTNQAKINHVRAVATTWPVQIVSPSQLGLNLDVTEDGCTVEENALKKARAFSAAAQMPAFAIDAGLTIEWFRPEQQPGVYVRRVHQQNHHVGDDEVIDYYRTALRACGGSTPGQWQVAIALVSPQREPQMESYTIDTLFTDQPSTVQIPGAPLSSLMVDPQSGRYYSEIAYEERPDSVNLVNALASLFQTL